MLLLPTLPFFPTCTLVCMYAYTHTHIYVYMYMYVRTRDIHFLSLVLFLSLLLSLPPNLPLPGSSSPYFSLLVGSTSVRRYLLRIGFSPSPSTIFVPCSSVPRISPKKIYRPLSCRESIFLCVERMKTVTARTVAEDWMFSPVGAAGIRLPPFLATTLRNEKNLRFSGNSRNR